jgi:hypothetical protein
MEDAVREQGGHGDRLEHRLKQRLMREPWHPSTLSSKLGKAEILARSIIKNGPITNSKRRATDIEKGAGIREAATVRIRIKSALSWKGETRMTSSAELRAEALRIGAELAWIGGQRRHWVPFCGIEKLEQMGDLPTGVLTTD